MKKIGIIDVGGGYKDIFGTGVFDYLLDENISVDYTIGVSAGSGNITCYISKQRGRNIPFYTEYPKDKEYQSFKNFLQNGSYLNFDYLCKICYFENKQSPFDYKTFIENKTEFEIVASCLETGLPTYFKKDDIKIDNFDVIKASCCIPFINQPIKINNNLYFDGGITDPIPIKRLLDNGIDYAIIILTRPIYEKRTNNYEKKLSIFLNQYPRLQLALKNRIDLYNKQLDYAKKLMKEDKVLIIAPDDISDLKLLTVDKEKQMALYYEGYNKGKGIKDFINRKSKEQ